MPEYSKVGYLHSDFKMFHIMDDSLEEITFHYHDYHKILILLSGNVSYCIEGRTYDLQPNDVVLVSAGEAHKPIVYAGAPYERIIIYISPEFLSRYGDAENDLRLCFKEAKLEQSHVLRFPSFSNSRLSAILKDLDASLHDTDYAHELHHKLLFLDFMIHLNRAALHKKVEFLETSDANDKVIQILNYLNEHLTEDLTIEHIASEFYLSRYYLMHTFKEQTGYTIGSYISTKRLLLAKERISNGYPITTVCYECGFKNYSTFSRAYKKCFGEAPRELRQK